MAPAPEIAVVGAGVVGLCAAYALRERGMSVRVYEPGRPGDAQSGGASRIFRHAHADPRLIAAARSSRALWREWGERLGLETVSDDGAVAIGEAVPARLAALRADGGVPARAIDAAELTERLPVLAGYDGPAMIDEAGGSIRTEAAVAALAGALATRSPPTRCWRCGRWAAGASRWWPGEGGTATPPPSCAPGAAPRRWRAAGTGRPR